jgi:mitochondrial import inner membrane translocase subunit TIM23
MSNWDKNADSQAEDATQFLRSASFARGEGSSSTAPYIPDAMTASDLLNGGALDPARLHPMAQIGDKLDYLLLDDDQVNQLPGAETALPSRGFSDDLCYGTGTTYLSGKVH